MILEIARVTARQLLGRRRTVLLALLSAVPVLVAALVRAGGGAGGPRVDADLVASLFVALIVTLLLPLVALLFSSAAFGAEIEDGTVVYLLAKPVPRSAIVGAKLAVASLATIALAGGATLLAGVVALAGADGAAGLIVGYTVGVSAGGVAYCAVFVALSLVTSRALVFGLLYSLVWEGALAAFFGGIRFLSIRQYALGIADAAGVGGRITADTLDAVPAIALALLALLAAVLVAIRRLRSFEIPQAD